MPEVFGFDCYSPKEIAERVENVGVTKANLPLLSMTALGVLAVGPEVIRAVRVGIDEAVEHATPISTMAKTQARDDRRISSSRPQ